MYDFEDTNRCVVCGDCIPEGRHICKRCELTQIKVDNAYEKGYNLGYSQAFVNVEQYLLKVLEEWNNLGDRKYDMANIQVYNHVRKCLDDLYEHIGEERF